MQQVSRSRLLSISGLVALDGLMFSFTNPGSVPSFILIIGFLLFAASLYCLILGLLSVFSWYGIAPGERHRRRFARITTGVLCGLAALQSIGELSPRDILVLLPLAVLAYLYFSYGQQQSGSKPNA